MKHKKKVFIYIHQCILKGGVEKVFLNLFNNLPDESCEITVLNHVAYLNNDLGSIKYKGLKKRYWFYYDEFSDKQVKRFVQRIHNKIMPIILPIWLRTNKYDIAIAAQEGMYAEFVNKNIRADRKLLWIHNDMLKCRFTEKLFDSTELERQCYLDFDKVICVSNDVKETMIERFGPMDNLCVCYNPIDTNEIDFLLNEKAPERPKDIPLFVCVGRLVEQKGFDRLLPICKKLNESGYKYEVWILGEGSDRNSLESYIRDNELFNVKLFGNQKNPFIYMKQADWMLCTSRHEGFNMVLHEATYCEVPIITTKTVGMDELLGDSKYGIVVENNSQAIESIMIEVLESPEIRDKYKKAISVRKNFVSIKERMLCIQKVLQL